MALLFHNQHLIWCLKLEMKVLLTFEDPVNFGPHAVEDRGLKIQKLYSLSWVARGSSHKNMHHQLPWFMNKHCSTIKTQFNGWLSWWSRAENLLVLYLLPYCRVSAASWQRTGFEAAMLTEDTGQEHRNIFYLAPKVLFLLQHIFSPLNLPFICV